MTADYKKEIKKMKKHRKLYRPAMSMLLDLYNRMKPSDLPVELIDHKSVLTILELIDIGYLDENALIVKKRFGSVTGLRYDGAYPFTDSGDDFYLKNTGIINSIIDKIKNR
jgi:hypothetical protein